MAPLAKAIALEVAAELRPVVTGAVAEAMKEASIGHLAGPAELPKMLTIRQAAAYLGVPEKTFRGWRQQREIPIAAVKLGGCSVRYRRVDLDRWIKSRQERPG